VQESASFKNQEGDGILLREPEHVFIVHGDTIKQSCDVNVIIRTFTLRAHNTRTDLTGLLAHLEKH